MFRALKDILSDTKPRSYDEPYYYSGERGTTGGGGLNTTRDFPQFYPVQSFPKEEYAPGGGGGGMGAPIIDLERRELGPIVKETIHPTERVEVQPILHRERELVEVRQLTQPILEKGNLPTSVHEEILPEERKVMQPLPQQAIEEQLRRAKEGLMPMQKREEVQRTVEEKPMIVEETVRKKIFEEIVPVVERHVTEPHLIKEKKPIFEKIYEGPTIVCKELPLIEREVPVQFLQQQSFASGRQQLGQEAQFGYGGQQGWQQKQAQYGGYGGYGQQGQFGGEQYGGKEGWFEGKGYHGRGHGSFVNVPVQSGSMPQESRGYMQQNLSPGQVRLTTA